MQLIEKKTVDFRFSDDRGSLTQLVHSGYEQINVLFTKKGVERGGHFHKKSLECFYVVSGSVKVTGQLGGSAEEHLFREGDFFQVNLNVIHNMYFPEDCVLVAMYDKWIEAPDGTKDIHPA